MKHEEKEAMKHEEKETRKQALAYDYWKALGPANVRPFWDVAAKFGTSAQTVRKWSRDFDWDTRLSIDFQKMVANIEDEATKVRNEILAVIKHVYGKVAVFNPDGTVKSCRLRGVRTLQDFERLVKLFMLLTGNPTEIVKGDVYHHDLRDVPEETLRAIAGNLPTKSGVRTGSA